MCILIYSCKKEEQVSECLLETEYELVKLTGNRPNLNISVLLDLSDRIDPEKNPDQAMELYLRDMGYIKSIAQSFEIHLRNKRNILIDDHIKVFLDPEPSDKNLNNKIRSLQLSFTKDNAKLCSILETSKLYDTIPETIYESSIKDGNYIGSDTWGFFKNKVHDYCIKEGFRNILVILTDGYIYHENRLIKEKNKTTYLTPQAIRVVKLNNSNWQESFQQNGFGFIKATSSLENLEVLVLGINPSDSNNPYEEDVIQAYWSKWLEEMEVPNYKIKGNDLPADMDKIIKQFIFNQ